MDRASYENSNHGYLSKYIYFRELSVHYFDAGLSKLLGGCSKWRS